MPCSISQVHGQEGPGQKEGGGGRGEGGGGVEGCAVQGLRGRGRYTMCA